MNFMQFEEQKKRLSDVFGEKHYVGERSRLIWKSVEHLPVGWFSDLISSLIASERFAPTPQTIMSAAGDFKMYLAQKEKRNTPMDRQCACANCRGLGAFLCTNDNLGGLWAFRCSCDAGSADPRRKIVQFKTGHADQGFVKYEMALT